MFAKEVINGQIIVVDRLKFKHILIAGKRSEKEPEIIALYLLQQITKINDNEVTIEFLKENEDFELFSFLMDSLKLQTENLNLI